MTYHQLTSEERYMLSALRKQGLSQAAIARSIARSPSTISRELQRNSCPTDGHYRPSKANRRARYRRSIARRNEQYSHADYQLIALFIRREWSPEQIVGRLRCEGIQPMSHESIYQYIWHDKAMGGDLHTYLRQASKKRRKRYQAYDSRGRLAGKRHISERPKEVEDRQTFGHWEIDTVVGRGAKDCIVTLVERKTGYLLIGKLCDRTKQQLNQRMLALIAQHDEKHFKTITADNGTEFHGYADIESASAARFYFATPHHSWERGTNENTNGLIRQYIPKRTSMARLTQRDCDAIAQKLNARPRKRLGYRTPAECFGEI